MAFPTSPTNGDTYVKDGVSYQYTAASNTWDIITDPDKIASNIKSGVEIDGITGTYTASPSVSGILGVTDPVTSQDVTYWQYGKMYIIRGYGSSDNFIGGGDFTTINASAGRIASLLGITISLNLIHSTSGGNITNLYYWNGSTWNSFPANNYLLHAIIST